MNVSTNYYFSTQWNQLYQEYIDQNTDSNGNVNENVMKKDDWIYSQKTSSLYSIYTSGGNRGTEFNTIRMELHAKLRSFYTGESNIEDVKECFMDTFNRVLQGNIDAQLTTGNDKDDIKKILEDLYVSFFREAFRLAISANYNEGKQIAIKDGSTRHDTPDWTYYNADYYYMLEDVFAAIGQCVDELALEYGLDNVEKEKVLSELPYNLDFNVQWSTNFSHNCRMINVNSPPPQGFSFYYRERIESTQIGKDMYANHRFVQTFFLCGKSISGSLDLGKDVANDLKTVMESTSPRGLQFNSRYSFNPFTRQLNLLDVIQKSNEKADSSFPSESYLQNFQLQSRYGYYHDLS